MKIIKTFEINPRQKSIFIAPEILHRLQYTIHRQKAGKFMIKAPCAYHEEFNQGENITESANWGGLKSG